MNKVAILIVDGFEDIELITAIDIFSRSKINFEVFSADSETKTTGKYGSNIKTKDINKLIYRNFNSLLLPGGTNELSKKKKVNELAIRFNNDQKNIFAICAAPYILFKNNILKNKKFTCWPGLKIKESTNNEIEVDGNIITGRDFRSSVRWVDEIVKTINNL